LIESESSTVTHAVLICDLHVICLQTPWKSTSTTIMHWPIQVNAETRLANFNTNSNSAF